MLLSIQKNSQHNLSTKITSTVAILKIFTAIKYISSRRRSPTIKNNQSPYPYFIDTNNIKNIPVVLVKSVVY